jgi:aminopeptidase-like protein
MVIEDRSVVCGRMRALMSALFPICRSITGPGVRETLARLQDLIPLQIESVPSGEQVLDWTVPDEWSIRDAYIRRAGTHDRLVDFRASNLHVVSYSEPVSAVIGLDELRAHLHTLPDRPTWVPYRTSYYARTWGFCLAHEVLEQLVPGDYEVLIDSDLKPGFLDYGELLIPGQTKEEVLLSTHICHPSLANDNLSGMVILCEVARWLLARKSRRYSYRLLWVPGTIGAIAWLARHQDVVERVGHGLVLTGLGDPQAFTYKSSRRGAADIDRIARNALRGFPDARVVAFSPYGYDERQYCSPGFDLPVGRLTRGVHGEFPEYHTSADNLEFVDDAKLVESLELVVGILAAIEANYRPLNLAPFGEPQLGRRGLYSRIGGGIDQRSVEMAYLWVLSCADGTADLCDISSRSDLPFSIVAEAAARLTEAGLLRDADRREAIPHG